MASNGAKFPLIGLDAKDNGKGDYKFIVIDPNIYFVSGQGDAPATIRLEMRVSQPKIPPEGTGAPVGTRAFGILEGDDKQPMASPGAIKEFVISSSKVALRIEDIGNTGKMARFVVEFEAPGAITEPINDLKARASKKQETKSPKDRGRNN